MINSTRPLVLDCVFMLEEHPHIGQPVDRFRTAWSRQPRIASFITVLRYPGLNPSMPATDRGIRHKSAGKRALSTRRGRRNVDDR